MIPYRDTEHNTDKTVPIQIIGAIMCSMVEQFGDILELPSEFRDHGVIALFSTAYKCTTKKLHQIRDALLMVSGTNRCFTCRDIKTRGLLLI